MRFLILGGNGMIGHKILEVLSGFYSDVYITQRSSSVHSATRDVLPEERILSSSDLSNPEAVVELLDEIQPDVIVNAAGLTIRRAKSQPILNSILVNSALPHVLGEWCVANGKRLIHFSTDCVFSGEKGDYTEDDLPDALDLYGKSKGLGEPVSYKGVLTLRGSMIGRELENHTELLEWFLSEKGNTVSGFTKAIYSGITTVRMANLVKQIISIKPQMEGLYNVSSDPISKYELLKLFNRAFKTGTEIQAEEGKVTNKNLISTRFWKELGMESPKWPDLVEELVEDSNKNKEYYLNPTSSDEKN